MCGAFDLMAKNVGASQLLAKNIGAWNQKGWPPLLYRNNGPKRYHQLTLRKKISLLCLLCKHFLLRKHSK